METIKQTGQSILTFASNFSDSSLAAVNMPVTLCGGAKLITSLGQKYLNIEPPAFIESLKLSKSLKLISSPIIALKATQEALNAYKQSDTIGFIGHAIASASGTIKTFKILLLVESIAIGAIHEGATSYLGQAVFKCSIHITLIIDGFRYGKLLISKFEVLSLHFQIWMCKDQNARADFLKGRLEVDVSSLIDKKISAIAYEAINQHDKIKSLPKDIRISKTLTDGQKLDYFDKMQGAKSALKRALGSKAVKCLKKNELDNLDSILKRGACIEVARVAFALCAIAYWVLSHNALIPEQLQMLVNVGIDLASLVDRIMSISLEIKDLRSPSQAYDQYLVTLGAGLTTAMAIVAAAIYPSTQSSGAIATLFMLSVCSMAYTYNKAKRCPDPKYDFSSLPEFSS